VAAGDFVQSDTASTTLNTIDVTLPSVASWNTLFAYVHSAGADDDLTVSDDKSNTWTQIALLANGAGGVVPGTLAVFYASGVASGSTVVTSARVNPSNSGIAAIVCEYAGTLTLDQYDTNTGSGSTTITAGPTATTSNPNGVVIGAFGGDQNDTYGFDSPDTVRETYNFLATFVDGVGDHRVTATGAYTVTGGTNPGFNTNYGGFVVVLTQAGGGKPWYAYAQQ
jgi:hypothetical protein